MFSFLSLFWVGWGGFFIVSPTFLLLLKYCYRAYFIASYDFLTVVG